MVGQFKYGKESAVRFRYKFRLQSVVASHRPYYDTCGIFQFGNGQTVSVALYSVGRTTLPGICWRAVSNARFTSFAITDSVL